MMKSKYFFKLFAVIALFSALSHAVQIVPLPAGTQLPKPRLDFKVMKEDASLYAAQSAQGAKARLNLATFYYGRAIDDVVNAVEAAGFLREILAAHAANKRIGAEARILLADLRRQDVFGDDARDIAEQMRAIIEAFTDNDLGTAARVRLILFRTERLVGDDVVPVEVLARLIDEVEGRAGVEAEFIATARNGLEQLRPRLAAPPPPQHLEAESEEGPVARLTALKQNCRRRVNTRAGAEARIDLAVLRINGQIGNEDLAIEGATELLHQVIRAHAPQTDLGARARANLAAVVLRENLLADMNALAGDLRGVITGFAADTRIGGTARINLAAMRAHERVNDEVITLDEVEALLEAVERQPADEGFVQNIAEIRRILRTRHQPPPGLLTNQMHADTANAHNQLVFDRLNEVVDDTVITLDAAAGLLREVIYAFGPATLIGARARINLAVMRIKDYTTDSPIWLANEMRHVEAAFPANTLQGGGARLNLVNLRLFGLIGDEIMTLDQVEAMLGEIEEDLARPEFQPAVEEARGNLQAERAAAQRMAREEGHWADQPLPELFDLQLPPHHEHGFVGLTFEPPVMVAPLPTLQLQPFTPPSLNVNPAVRAIVTAVGQSIGAVFGIPLPDMEAPEPPQKRGKGNQKKRR